ncbi:MAG: MauE/DoxX family redox-associated membrane protein [Gammaproteobacteria bacterium]
MRALGSFCLRLFLGLLFTATGLAKLLDNRGFARVIAGYRLGLPDAVLLPLGLCISLAELWIGANILRGQRLRFSLWATLFIQTGYGALAAITLARGIALDNCGCFGVFLARPLRFTTVLEDVLLATASALALRLLRNARKGVVAQIP